MIGGISYHSFFQLMKRKFENFNNGPIPESYIAPPQENIILPSVESFFKTYKIENYHTCKNSTDIHNQKPIVEYTFKHFDPLKKKEKNLAYKSKCYLILL